MKIVSEKQPPELRTGEYWERSPDPFHTSQINLALAQAGFATLKEDKEPSKDGWMLINWVGNPVAWVADGSDAGNPQEFEIKEGPYKHLCAYPIKPPPVQDGEQLTNNKGEKL